MVVELDGIHFHVVILINPDGEAVAVGAHGVPHEVSGTGLAGLARILAESRLFPCSVGIFKQRL